MACSASATAMWVSQPRRLHGCGVCVGEELGSLREVLARLARGGATDSIGAVEQQGGTVGDGVKHNEHASGEEEEALHRQRPWRRHVGI
jgi:hypothetical protein